MWVSYFSSLSTDWVCPHLCPPHPGRLAQYHRQSFLRLVNVNVCALITWRNVIKSSSIHFQFNLEFFTRLMLLRWMVNYFLNLTLGSIRVLTKNNLWKYSILFNWSLHFDFDLLTSPEPERSGITTNVSQLTSFCSYSVFVPFIFI